MMDKQRKPTKAALKALRRAAKRPHGHICPTPGVHAAAQAALLASLARSGWADDSHAPCITDAGRTALATARQEG